jgi:crossover junction endodeoxyribonuclease RuvC
MQNNSIKILGIDPGTATLGWGIILKNGSSIKPVNYGIIETSSKEETPKRLFKIFTELCDIIEGEKPDCSAVEQIFFFKNQKTVIPVAQARGVAIIACETLQIPVAEYTPLQVKQALTGYGRAEKKQIQEMVKVICKLKECPKPDDAADALAVAICHSQTNANLKPRSKIL